MDEDTETNEQYEESFDDNVKSGDAMPSRETVIEELFDTEKRIELLRRNWRGDLLKPNPEGSGFVWVADNKELAGDRFINKQVSALRAICNPTNSFSKKPYIELKRILHDAVEAFILDMVNDPTIKKRDYRTLSKSYEHFIELFMGLPESGHGSKVLRDALAGINTLEKEKEDRNIPSSLSRLFGDRR